MYHVSGTYLITGAAGYVGTRLANWLLSFPKSDCWVILFDIQAIDLSSIKNAQQHLDNERLYIFQGDIRDDLTPLFGQFERITTVFHICSYGMSGKEMVAGDLIYDINVHGSQNIMQACIAQGHPIALIYTSTVNVCFGGQTIVNASEDACYAKHHHDAYSASKTKAESYLLQTSLQYDYIHCCALRPYGIYGEGEQRHFPRMINYFKLGFYCRFGHESDLSDWVHVDNLVHAMLLADCKLHSNNDRGDIDGNAYFIGDNVPTNTILMCEPLATMVGTKPLVDIWIPFWIMMYAASLSEWTYRVIHCLSGIRFTPLLSVAEVEKVAVTHYWQHDRVERELQYTPIISRQNGLDRMYSYFQRQLKSEGYPKPYRIMEPFTFRIISIIIIMTLCLKFYCIQ